VEEPTLWRMMAKLRRAVRGESIEAKGLVFTRNKLTDYVVRENNSKSSEFSCTIELTERARPLLVA